MAWRIEVSRAAREDILALDPSLRDELIDRVAQIADAPIEHLRLPYGFGERAGTLVYEYASEVIGDLRVSVYFDLPDITTMCLRIVGISHVSDPGPA